MSEALRQYGRLLAIHIGKHNLPALFRACALDQARPESLTSPIERAPTPALRDLAEPLLCAIVRAGASPLNFTPQPVLALVRALLAASLRVFAQTTPPLDYYDSAIGQTALKSALHETSRATPFSHTHPPRSIRGMR